MSGHDGLSILSFHFGLIAGMIVSKKTLHTSNNGFGTQFFQMRWYVPQKSIGGLRQHFTTAAVIRRHLVVVVRIILSRLWLLLVDGFRRCRWRHTIVWRWHITQQGRFQNIPLFIDFGAGTSAEFEHQSTGDIGAFDIAIIGRKEGFQRASIALRHCESMIVQTENVNEGFQNNFHALTLLLSDEPPLLDVN